MRNDCVIELNNNRQYRYKKKKVLIYCIHSHSILTADNVKIEIHQGKKSMMRTSNIHLQCSITYLT